MHTTDPFSYICPYCYKATTINYPDCKRSVAEIIKSRYHEDFTNTVNAVLVTSIQCPNTECQKTSLWLTVGNYSPPQEFFPDRPKNSAYFYRLPDKNCEMRIFPDSPNIPPKPRGVPDAIYKIYKEAVSIESLSASASAVLARKCLEAIICDFYGIKKKAIKSDNKGQPNKTLEKIMEEMEKEKIDEKVVVALNKMRAIANFSAHIKEPTNLMQDDIMPEEVKDINEVIYFLFEALYQRRYDKDQSLKQINKTFQEKIRPKKPLKSNPPK